MSRFSRVSFGVFMWALSAAFLGPALAQAPSSSPNRFALSVNGQEVIDLESKLVWKRCLEGMRLEAGHCLGEPVKIPWSDAHARAKTMETPSLGAWRLPTMAELSTVINMNSHYDVTDRELFPDTPRVYVWSATVNERTPSQAWVMFYANGYMMSSWQSVEYCLRLVRDPQ